MTTSNCTRLTLSLSVNELLNAFEWLGTPHGDAGVFTIGERYLVRFRELRFTIMPESLMGIDMPIVSMRYEASLVTGDEWTTDDGLFGTVPNGKWCFDGRDDLGTEYEYQQGASGFSDPARRIFDSDISFEPEVPIDASWVEIRFMDASASNHPIHAFRADVPALQEILVS